MAESEFNPAWEQALKQRYGKSSFQENLAEYRQQLAGASDKKAFATSEYNAVRNIFRAIVSKDKNLAQYSWDDNQLHHIRPKGSTDFPDPEGAVDPNNLLFTRGNARSPGTSHNAAQYGEGEIRRQEWEASRQNAGEPQEPSPAPPEPSTPPPEPNAAGPAASLAETESGASLISGAVGIASGTAKAVGPAIALEWGRRSMQAKYDAAAELRLRYNGTPTPEQIEQQRAVGFEYTGKLDKDGRPEWEYSPGFQLRLQNATHWLFNPFQPLQPQGSWYDPSTA